MSKDVYFVRHGESRANATGIREGKESPLTLRGIQQAKLVAKRLREKKIEHMLASDYLRAQETAAIIAPHLGFTTFDTSELLGERRNPSVMLGSHVQDQSVQDMWNTIAKNYGIRGWRHSDEENFEDLVIRAQASLALLERIPKERIVVASHGMFMKVILAHVQLDAHLDGRIFWDRYVPMKNIQNTGIMHLQYTDNFHGTAKYWKFMSWNDHAHLEGAMADDSAFMS